MAPVTYRFEGFVLDAADRRLRRGEETIELSGRYFDALVLLVREQGRLVTKERLLEEVWRGVPVTDEALTQCVRSLRRSLGDEAARPRFIETVPKHGYRFVAVVEAGDHGVAADRGAARPQSAPWPANLGWRPVLTLGAAGMGGGAAAGVLGGLFYGFGAAAPGAGAASLLAVMVAVATLLGLIAGGAVGLGIGAAELVPGRQGRWSVLGGAVGGMIVGAVVKMLGLDAFTLLIGASPGAFTGGPEGAVMGAAAGVGAWAALQMSSRRAAVLGGAGLAGALAGISITLLGGRLLGGSLALLAEGFPGSRLSLERLGRLFGETGFGPVSRLVTSGLEGAVFALCMAIAFGWAWRSLARAGSAEGRP